ncbi:MAG: hypothetical protein U1F83_13300 [Verrucomicrobiota bacterium]
MTRDEFRKVVEEALEQLVTTAEQRINRKLPRQYCLSGLGSNKVASDDATEFLTNWVFVDESHIFPCVDLFLEELLPDGRLRFSAYRAGYEPCAFGEHVTYRLEGHDSGRVGPFKIGCYNFVEQMKSG